MKLDDFEAVFRSAVKERFHLAPPSVESIVVITDMDAPRAEEFSNKIKNFLGHLDIEGPRWRILDGSQYDTLVDLLAALEDASPDLVACYRHLRGHDKSLRHSLGSWVDTLTQAARFPVLLMPPPVGDAGEGDEAGAGDEPRRVLDRVLVVTDHITGDDRLVNWGVRVCPGGGHLFLAHVEDAHTYARYVELLSMIPDADTETTQRRLTDKLLGRPADYIQSTIEVLEAAGVDEDVTPIVAMGHTLIDYRRIIDAHDIDLVVLNTKDEQQLAMHGMAYAIAVEIQDIPLLLL